MASFVVNENIGGTPKRPSLLTIPVDARDRRDDLVMMQLPSSLKAIDLVGSRIIVNDKKSNEKKNDTSLPLLSQACLVSDDRAFLMSRVETSNAWILVEGKTTVKDDKRPTKRLKSNASTVSLRDNKFGQVIPVELLGNGSGASFWELKERKEDVSALLRAALPVWNPFEHPVSNFVLKHKNTTSVDGLVLTLLLSRKQVQDGLKTLFAVLIGKKDDAGDETNGGVFVIVGEEAQIEARNGVIATLLEEPDLFEECTNEGVDPASLISMVRDRLVKEEQYEGLEDVLRQCTLPTLGLDTTLGQDPGMVMQSTFRICFPKVRSFMTPIGVAYFSALFRSFSIVPFDADSTLCIVSHLSSILAPLCVGYNNRLRVLLPPVCSKDKQSGWSQICCGNGNPRFRVSVQSTPCRPIFWRELLLEMVQTKSGCGRNRARQSRRIRKAFTCTSIGMKYSTVP